MKNDACILTVSQALGNGEVQPAMSGFSGADIPPDIQAILNMPKKDWEEILGEPRKDCANDERAARFCSWVIDGPWGQRLRRLARSWGLPDEAMAGECLEIALVKANKSYNPSRNYSSYYGLLCITFRRMYFKRLKDELARPDRAKGTYTEEVDFELDPNEDWSRLDPIQRGIRQEEARAFMEALSQCFNELKNEKQRAAFILVVVQNMPYAKAAACLGEPVGGVAVRTMRAKQKIAKCLKNKGIIP
jgi:RNA polymerase sigma factor (sigma-70 family)